MNTETDQQSASSLLSRFPIIAKEWDFDKNGDLLPSNISYGSKQLAWWVCGARHSYDTTVNSRTNQAGKRGCGICSGHVLAIGINDFETTHPDLFRQLHPTKNPGIDVSSLTASSNELVWWLGPCGHVWEARIRGRARGHGCHVCRNHIVVAGINDLTTTFPEVAALWHSELNPGVAPTQVTAGSQRRVWWRCPDGHAYCASVSDRVRRRSSVGCNICSGRVVVAGINDLASIFPSTRDLWDSDKNDPYNPQQVYYRSQKCFYWKREQCGHSWHASVRKQVDRSHECPICFEQHVRGKPRFLPGQVPLSVANPEISNDWHDSKNYPLTPDAITYGSHRVVWWLCQRGHEYSMAVTDRTRSANARSCPICSGRKILVGLNDLKTTHPQLVKEWHVTKNFGVTVEEVSKGSHKKVWWQGSCGHEWQQQVRARALNSQGCPICAGNALLQGENDLLTVRPELAAQWDIEKNGDLSPSDVMPNSMRKVWWLCPRGHSWASTVNNRFKGNGCRFCGNRFPLEGVSDLATTNPELIAEWNHAKNGDVRPSNVGAGSSAVVWWICPNGHDYKSAIATRSLGGGCTRCSNRTSQIQEAFYHQLSKHFPSTEINANLRVRWGHMSNVLLEVLIRVGDVRIAVEYDGSFWHRHKETNDTLKTEALLAEGFLVVRIRENELFHLNIKNTNLFQISHTYIKVTSKKEIQRRHNSVTATCNEISNWIDEKTGPSGLRAAKAHFGVSGIRNGHQTS